MTGAHDAATSIGILPMNDAPFDPSADRKMVTLSVNGDLLDKVQAAGIDLTQVVEKALERALWNASPEEIRRDIANEMRWLEEYVAKHGDPRIGWLTMSDDDDAA
jgi:hypothetical protein